MTNHTEGAEAFGRSNTVHDMYASILILKMSGLELFNHHNSLHHENKGEKSMAIMKNICISPSSSHEPLGLSLQGSARNNGRPQPLDKMQRGF